MLPRCSLSAWFTPEPHPQVFTVRRWCKGCSIWEPHQEATKPWFPLKSLCITYFLFFVFLGFVCLFVFKTGFLCTSLCVPELAQVGLNFRDPPASSSQQLGLKVGTTIVAFKAAFGIFIQVLWFCQCGLSFKVCTTCKLLNGKAKEAW